MIRSSRRRGPRGPEGREEDNGSGGAQQVGEDAEPAESVDEEGLHAEQPEVHEEAERLEHVISEDFERRIAAALGHPVRDPHGEPIPTADLKMPVDDSAPLSSLRPNQSGTIQRVNAENALSHGFVLEKCQGGNFRDSRTDGMRHLHTCFENEQPHVGVERFQFPHLRTLQFVHSLPVCHWP